MLQFHFRWTLFHPITLFSSERRPDALVLSLLKEALRFCAQGSSWGPSSALDSLPNCSQRPYCAFPHAFVLFRSQLQESILLSSRRECRSITHKTSRPTSSIHPSIPPSWLLSWHTLWGSLQVHISSVAGFYFFFTVVIWSSKWPGCLIRFPTFIGDGVFERDAEEHLRSVPCNLYFISISNGYVHCSCHPGWFLASPVLLLSLQCWSSHQALNSGLLQLIPGIWIFAPVRASHHWPWCRINGVRIISNQLGFLGINNSVVTRKILILLYTRVLSGYSFLVLANLISKSKQFIEWGVKTKYTLSVTAILLRTHEENKYAMFWTVHVWNAAVVE